MELKFRYILAIGIIGFVGGFLHGMLTKNPVSEQMGNSTMYQVNPFLYSGGYVKTASTTAGLQITSLASCDTIDTDADGKFSCGVDDGGASSFSTSTTDYWFQNDAQLGELSDVSTTSISAGDILYWDGSNWVDIATSTMNVGTASALVANGANCDAGYAPLGVDASGAVENCFDVWTETENTNAGYQTAANVYSIVGSTTTLPNLSITESQISNLDHYTDADANAYIHASTTIPKTYTANTFTGVQTFGNASGTMLTLSGNSWLGTILTGTWNGTAIGDAYLTKTGDWTGTIDGNNFAGGAVATGDLLYGSDAGVISELGIGASSTVLTTAGTTPKWQQIFFNMIAGLVDLATQVTGLLKHENGGLEADVSGYSGLVAISGGATSEVDAKSELESQIADVADFAEADGDTYSGTHDFGGATSFEIPNGESPTVDAIGEIALKTSPANALLIATSTNASYPAIIPLYQPIKFTTFSSSTATTTLGWNTLDYGERLISGTCVGQQAFNIRIGDGTNWSNLVAVTTSTTTVTFTSNNTFVSGGEQVQIQISPTTTDGQSLRCAIRGMYEL